MSGKGDTPRPGNRKRWEAEFERIFAQGDRVGLHRNGRTRLGTVRRINGRLEVLLDPIKRRAR